jgi:D-galactarolactone cycloisomerase
VKIVSVEPRLIAHRRGDGASPSPALRALLVRVETDDGLVGWGEAFGFGAIPATQTAVETLVTPMAVGRDLSDPAALTEDLGRALHLFGRSGPVQFALAGLDIALWDLAAKRAGCGLASLIGGRQRETVPAYASLPRYGDPARVSAAVQAALKAGYGAIKLHEITEEAVAAAREVIGPGLPLMVDVNCAWDRADAIVMARRFERFDLTWLEEPIWPPEDLEGLQQLRAAAGVPLATGENLADAAAFAPFITAGIPDFLQPSVIKIGVTAFLKVARSAEAAGRSLAPHSPYFGPGLLATLQLAAAFPSIGSVEIYDADLERTLYGAAAWPDARGVVAIPDGPGLGLEPDPGALEALAFTPDADTRWAPPPARSRPQT